MRYSEEYVEFKPNSALTAEDLNSLLQKYNVVDDLTEKSKGDVVSQYGVAKAIEEAKNYSDNANAVLKSELQEFNNVGRGVSYCKGTCDGNEISASPADASTGAVAVTKGTTVIVKMTNYFASNNDARLSFGGVNKLIAVKSTNGVKHLQYSKQDSSAENSIRSSHLFMKDAEYEFYYNGAYWMLKNNIVQQSAVSDYVNEYPNKIFIGHRGYRIWADGYLEQWGYANLKKQSVINFLLPFTNTKFNFMFGSESSILTFKNKKNTSIEINGYNGFNEGTRYWTACGY